MVSYAWLLLLTDAKMGRMDADCLAVTAAHVTSAKLESNAGMH